MEYHSSFLVTNISDTTTLRPTMVLSRHLLDLRALLGRDGRQQLASTQDQNDGGKQFGAKEHGETNSLEHSQGFEISGLGFKLGCSC